MEENIVIPEETPELPTQEIELDVVDFANEEYMVPES